MQHVLENYKNNDADVVLGYDDYDDESKDECISNKFFQGQWINIQGLTSEAGLLLKTKNQV